MLGVVYALVALIGWGFGDFFIQKSIRRIGLHETLFIVAAGASVALAPFVWQEALLLSLRDILMLTGVSLIMYAYSFVLFSALKRGKLSVVESVSGLELPLTVLLSIFIAQETLSFGQGVLVGAVIVGIFLAVTKNVNHLRGRSAFEKGAWLAFGAVMLSSLTNFLVGISAKQISPLLAIWVIHCILMALRGAVLLYLGNVGKLVRCVRANPVLGVSAVVCDNAAWVGFALAVPLIGIAVTTTISESYIALAALLGIFVNGERLRVHQFVGASIAIIGVIVFTHMSTL